MKLLRYGPPGAEKPGLLDASGVLRDLSGTVPDINGGTISDEGLRRLAGVNTEGLPKVEGSPRLGPCVARPLNFICIGLNYRDHAQESNQPLPEVPMVIPVYRNALAGPRDEIVLPKGHRDYVDYEGELAIVIGRRCRHVRAEDALECVG